MVGISLGLWYVNMRTGRNWKVDRIGYGQVRLRSERETRWVSELNLRNLYHPVAGEGKQS